MYTLYAYDPITNELLDEMETSCCQEREHFMETHINNIVEEH